MIYKGPERRKNLHLREVVRTARPLQKKVLKDLVRGMHWLELSALNEDIRLDKKKAAKSKALKQTLTFEEVLAELSDKRKLVLKLKLEKGHTYAQIGSMFGQSSHNISYIVKHTLKLLRRRLKFCKPIDKKTFEENKILFKAVGYETWKQFNANRFHYDKNNKKTILKLPVEALNLSGRAANGLRAANIKTLQQLVRHSGEDLLRTNNFGRRSLEELKEALAAKGLQLGMQLN